MFTLLFGYILFLFFMFIGILTISFFNLKENFYKNNGFWLLTPILGIYMMIFFGEMLFLVLPQKYVGWLFISSILFLSFKNRKNLIMILNYIFKTKKLYFFIFALSGFLISIPVLKSFSLVSTQILNNDIIFYFSSMDWLYNNSFFNIDSLKVVNTLNPYYYAASYLIRSSRFATEIVGSQIMGILFLKAHQVYFALGVSMVSITISTFGFFLESILKIESKKSKIIIFALSFNMIWFELQRMQYVPQILGIGGIVLFLGIMLSFLEEEYNLKFREIMLGISLAGLMSVYSEYALITVMIFLITLGVLVCTNKNNFKNKFFSVVKGCLFSFIISPVGMIKAIRYNILLIIKSPEINSGDPYHGKMIQINNYIQNFLGFKNLHIPSENNFFEKIIFILSIVVIFSLLIFIFKSLIKNKNPKDISLVLIIIFFAFNLLSFRIVKFAYAEYKTLITVQSVIILILFYFMLQFTSKNIFFKYYSYFILCIYVLINLINIRYMSRDEYFFYDNNIIELENEISKIPKEKIIDVSGTFNIAHSIMYAAKEHNLRLNTETYYPKNNIPIDKVDYFVKYKDEEINNLLKTDESIFWENDKYKILNRNRTQLVNINLIDGFYNLEKDNVGYFIWTSKKESKIEISNDLDKKVLFKLEFKIYGAPGIDKNIKVIFKNKVIGFGKTPKRIKTTTIELNAKEKGEILILSEEPLTQINTDSRNFGIQLREIKLYIE